MTSSISGLLDILTGKMSYLNQKQAVLAENVANSDTPGYRQLDVKPFSFGDAMRQADISMAVTDARHIVPAGMAGVNARTFVAKDAVASPSGNSVDLEGQMMEISKTAADYKTMTAIYHKMTGLFKIALKGSAT